MVSRDGWNDFAGHIWPAGSSLETPDIEYFESTNLCVFSILRFRFEKKLASRVFSKRCQLRSLRIQICLRKNCFRQFLNCRSSSSAATPLSSDAAAERWWNTGCPYIALCFGEAVNAKFFNRGWTNSVAVGGGCASEFEVHGVRVHWRLRLARVPDHALAPSRLCQASEQLQQPRFHHSGAGGFFPNGDSGKNVDRRCQAWWKLSVSIFCRHFCWIVWWF